MSTSLPVSYWWTIEIAALALFEAIMPLWTPTRKTRIKAALAPFASTPLMASAHWGENYSIGGVLAMHSLILVSFITILTPFRKTISRMAIEYEKSGKEIHGRGSWKMIPVALKVWMILIFTAMIAAMFLILNRDEGYPEYQGSSNMVTILMVRG